MTRKECIGLNGREEPAHDWLDYVCQTCFIFDEDGALARIRELEDQQTIVRMESKAPKVGLLDSRKAVEVTPTYSIQIEHQGMVWEFRTVIAESGNPPVMSQWMTKRLPVPPMPEPRVLPDTVRRTPKRKWWGGEGK